MGNTRTSGDVKNELRMPLAQWVSEMHEAGVSRDARALAMYVAMFRVRGNAELSMLSELEGKTLDKYKNELKKGGWIVPSRVNGDKGGRGVYFEPIPARAETPVNFTDLIPRKGGKYYPGNEIVDTGVKNTGVMPETPAETAQVSKEKSPQTPLKENTLLQASKQSDAARELAGLNGSTEPMIADVMVWMTGGGDRQLATNWLTTFLRQYSEEVVRQAYFDLKTDLANGRLVSNKLRVWGLKAAAFKSHAASKNGAEKPKPSRFANFGKRYTEPLKR